LIGVARALSDELAVTAEHNTGLDTEIWHD